MNTSKAKEKRIHCYNSSQKILLVGEGNFSFSACLARALRSADNIVATSYHSENLQVFKHSTSKTYLEELKTLGCLLVFEVDVNKMHTHPVLKEMKFDVIIYNFPHAGHYSINETSLWLIEMHRKLVGAYFKSASKMLNEGGEVHLRHRDDSPYNKWNVISLAGESGLKLKDKVNFLVSDYPGYWNIRGGDVRTNETFPISCAFTFKFSLDLLENDRDGMKNYEVINDILNNVPVCDDTQSNAGVDDDLDVLVEKLRIINNVNEKADVHDDLHVHLLEMATHAHTQQHLEDDNHDLHERNVDDLVANDDVANINDYVPNHNLLTKDEVNNHADLVDTEAQNGRVCHVM